MRVLHVIGSLAPRYGGPTSAALAMCDALARAGHDVEVLTTDVDGHRRLDVPLGTWVSAGMAQAQYFPVRRPRSYCFSPELFRALARRVPEVDVVHIHSLYLFHGWAAARAARAAGVPYVIRPHGTLDAYHRQSSATKKRLYDALVETRNINGAAAIHCASDMERHEVEGAGITTPCVVVPLAVDTERFAEAVDPTDLVGRFPALGERAVVCFLGRLTEKKQLPVLIDALARCDDVILAIAGPDDEGILERLRARAAGLGIADRVVFLGLLGDYEKRALLQLSRAFVLPSLDENFGVSVVEALAAGTPVLVSRHVAVAEDVVAADAGRLIDVHPDSIARAIEAIAENDDAARAMGQRARRLAQERFAPEHVAAGLGQLYASVVEMPTSERRRAA